MAEFIQVGTKIKEDDGIPYDKLESGFNAMGKPIPMFRRQAAYEHCKAMGMTDKNAMTTVVGQMVQQLERDKPYEAMDAAMKYLDLTGTYRLMAVLLTAERSPDDMKEMG